MKYKKPGIGQERPDLRPTGARSLDELARRIKGMKIARQAREENEWHEDRSTGSRGEGKDMKIARQAREEK